MVTSTSSTNLLANPTTFQTKTSAAPVTALPFAPRSAPRWQDTTAGTVVIVVVVIVISIISVLCWIFRKTLRKWGLQLALKFGPKERSESDNRKNNKGDRGASEEGGGTEGEAPVLSEIMIEGQQRGESAGRSRDEIEPVERRNEIAPVERRDEIEPVERRDHSQGAGALNAVRNGARSSLHPQLLYVDTKNGQTYDLYAKLDSSADDNLISITELRKLGYDKGDLTPSTFTWNVFGNDEMPTLGSIELTWTVNNRKREPVKFYVLEVSFTQLVLGQAFSFKKGLLVYDRTAWTVTRNEKPMSSAERVRMGQEQKERAQQNLDGRGVCWEYKAATGWYFFIDELGRKVYQNQGGGPTGGSSGSGTQGQNPGG